MNDITSKDNNKQTNNRIHEKKMYTHHEILLYISIVIIVILILVIIWLFTRHTDSEFVSHFSFASTITSIVLSVLAIIMSVFGESKMEVIKYKIEREVDEIIIISDKLEKQIETISNQIVENTNTIKTALNENPGKLEIVNADNKVNTNDIS